MMPKFIIQNSIKAGGRRGTLHELVLSCLDLSRDQNNLKIETPACLLHTKNGCVPHLTDDVLQEITRNPLPLLVPVVSVAHNETAVKSFGKGLGTFIGLQEHILYLSVQDPGVGTPRGFNDKLGISMWSKSGRFQVNTSKYMDIQEAFQPAIYEALYDGDTDSKSTKKRISKSVTRSLQYLDECIERHQKSEIMKNASIFGAVVGGYCLTQRQYSAKQTALRPVDGFVIEGLHNYGPLVENMNFIDVQDMLIETLKLLPENKPRVFHGPCNPKFVLEAVEIGIDMFDSSYPYLATERGCALIFSFNYREPDAQSDCYEMDLKNIRTASMLVESFFEAVLQLLKCVDELYSVISCTFSRQLQFPSLEFKEDFTPLVKNCECYTCQQHTKSYISHLLFTEEMLAHVLLSISIKCSLTPI